MRECEENLKSVHSRRALWLDLATGKSPKVAHVWSMQGSWRFTLAVALLEKTSSLVRQLTRDSNLWLVPVASLSRQNALFVRNLIIHIPHSLYYKYPYTHEMLRASRENFERETLEKTRLTHPQSSSFDSPNSSTLTFSIDISLRGTLAKSLSHHTHICEKVFWCLGSSSEETNSFWLMQWAIVGFGKLEKTRFGVTLGKLGLEGLLFYLIFIFRTYIVWL